MAFNDRPLVPNGEDLSDALYGIPTERDLPLKWQYRNLQKGHPLVLSPHSAILSTDGRWKLLENFPGERVELYDLFADPLELYNRAEEEPAIVDTLRGQLETWMHSLPGSYFHPEAGQTGEAVWHWPGE